MATVLSVAAHWGWRSPGPTRFDRGRDVTRTCVWVLHQAEDHTGLFINIEAQSILLLRHVDEEVGISVHWGRSTESIRLVIVQLDWGRPGARQGCPSDPPQDSPPVTRFGNCWMLELD